MCACSQDENQIAIVNAPIHIFLFGFKRKFSSWLERVREVYLTDAVRVFSKKNSGVFAFKFKTQFFFLLLFYQLKNFVLWIFFSHSLLYLINILKWKTYVTEILHELCGGLKLEEDIDKIYSKMIHPV